MDARRILTDPTLNFRMGLNSMTSLSEGVRILFIIDVDLTDPTLKICSVYAAGVHAETL